MNGRKFLLKLTEKWPAKVISLAVALIISIFYRLNTLDSRVLTVPLRVDVSSEFIPVDSVSNTVRVTLRGEPNSILTITENDIEAFIDLSKYKKTGIHRVPVQIRKKDNAAGIEPLEISVSPIEFRITLEEKISRFIHVYPAFSGTVAPGFELINQSVTPESVIAEGPRSAIEKLNEFTTSPIDLDGRNSDFTMLVNIKNDNPNITIHGNKMIEYSCTISRIERSTPLIYFVPFEEDNENDKETEE